MKRSLGLLIAGSAAFWAVVAVPAALLGGESSAVVFSAVAGLLCLVPTVATFLWCGQAFQGTPEQQLLAVLGGTGVRMVFVVGVGMVLFHALPYFHHQRFWLWVILFYLVTLALEMSLLVRRQPAADRSPNN